MTSGVMYPPFNPPRPQGSEPGESMVATEGIVMGTGSDSWIAWGEPYDAYDFPACRGVIYLGTIGKCGRTPAPLAPLAPALH